MNELIEEIDRCLMELKTNPVCSEDPIVYDKIKDARLLLHTLKLKINKEINQEINQE